MFLYSNRKINNMEKAVQTQAFKLPIIATPIEWYNRNITYIIGSNGTGKTMLINQMKEWCNNNQYNYNAYDATVALQGAHYLIQHASDIDIKHACKKMADLSMDFKDELSNWFKEKKDDDDIFEDVKTLRTILELSGSGYTRLFVMTIKAISNPSADYYFLDMPETSLHILMARRITKYIYANFPYMKIVIATHSPQVISDVYSNTEEAEEASYEIIELDKYFAGDPTITKFFN